ncbi:ubiquitin ligase, putative [Trypanosoma brucei gambiense DAL972]|uniref:E3 ubiquitin-protein ligase n=1 Tax=Trypanosoma brucei gambiense (strain MHOM/CI/86/DAL972) TaxID=679716 RepID=D0A9F6_TRYB9|nr:ubiquitin ligase, putative [Trypanosoma brucei gambiense DAL972]CBH18307.1 ubiquitin ligase, putative [Trypanosoma brucei gambiense DAL972]|eukprot:XP_011780571.1 ubiquitin ligase, putative [Trypanosoma brucei gambiense DAL972]
MALSGFASVQNPMDPRKWTSGTLLEYLQLHELSTGMEWESHTVGKEERLLLVRAVRDDLDRFYHMGGDASGLVPLENVLETDPKILLKCRVPPGAATLLRQYPQKLGDTVNAGLEMLMEERTKYSSPAAWKCTSNALPMVEWWLGLTVDEEGEKMIREETGFRVCGRSFQPGEILVFCKDCASDCSCVMCSDCFKSSPCINHNYVVRQCLIGGGMCDCGDPSAWKTASFCTRHRGFQSSADPAADMDCTKRQWLEVLSRGLVLYITTIVGAQAEYQCNSNSSDDQLARMQWFDRALRRIADIALLLSTSGDGPRRVLCHSLMEKALVSRRVECVADGKRLEEMRHLSCMEELFLYGFEIPKLSRFSIWERSILWLFNNTLCDPLIRVPFAELLLKYGERGATRRELHVATLSVQVFTSSDVVDSLLLREPHPKWESVLKGETILHRLISCLLYCSCETMNVRNASPQEVSRAVRCCRWMTEVLCVTQNTCAIVVSRQLYRGWCRLLTINGSASMVFRRTSVGESDGGSVETDCAMNIELELQQMFHRIANMARDVAVSLHAGELLIPPRLLESLSSSSWCSALDPAVESSKRRDMLEGFSVQGGSALLVGGGGVGCSVTCREYMRELMRECMVAINALLQEKRGGFSPKEVISVDADGKPLLERYDLLDKKSPNPTSFVLPHMRFFAEIVKSWMKVQKRIEESGAGVEQGSFVSLLSELFAETEARADYWIDELLMPLVLLCQHEQGLWHGERFELSRRCECYVACSTLMIEADVCMMQLLMLLVPTETFAAQLLNRFMFSKENRALGYTGFLRLVLTLCVQDCSLLINNKADLVFALKRRLLHVIAGDRGHSLDDLERVASELEHALPGINLDELLPLIFREVTTTVKSRKRAVVQFKDVCTWRSYINLYHPSLRDHHLPDMCDLYDRLVRRKRMGTDSGGEGDSNDAPAVFPPPNIRWVEVAERPEEGSWEARRAAVFRDKVFLLLQDPCVLSVAIRAVHGYMFDGLEGCSGSEGTVSIITLAHAISLLYLAMRACTIIGAGASGGSAATVVDWDAVGEFHKKNSSPPIHAPQQLNQLLGVEGLLNARNLKEALEVPVEADLVFGAGRSPVSTASATTTVDALRKLRTRFREVTKDIFGIVGMVEFILQGMSEPSLSVGADKPAVGESQRGEGECCRPDVKGKQSALLKRMKAINAKKSFAMLSDPSRFGFYATQDAPAPGVKPSVCEGGSHSSVANPILQRIRSMDCCICRDHARGSLALFGNVSVSDVLDRLRFDDTGVDSHQQQPQKRKLSTHFYLCGHAAHMRCVKRIFGRMASTVQNTPDMDRLPAAVTRNDFSCPMCLMVCTTLCPCPVPPANVATGEASSLFEMVRESSLRAVSSDEAARGALQSLWCDISSVAVTNSSCDGSGNESRSVRKQPRDENKNIREVVEVARSVRAQMCVALEWVKVGGAVLYNELLALLSLMISLEPILLEGTISHACAELSCHDVDDNFCVLILNALLHPSDAAEYVAQYTTLLLHSSDFSALTSGPVDDDGQGAHSGLLMSVWRELGCLTLLKALLTDNTPSEVAQIGDDKVVFIPFQSEELATLEGQSQAVFTMLCYLLQKPLQNCEWGHTKASEALVSLIHKAVSDGNEKMIKGTTLSLLHRCRDVSLLDDAPRFKPLGVVYEGALLWKRFLMNRVLHLPDAHAQLLLSLNPNEPCSMCGDTEGNRLLCCFCGKLFCLRPSQRPPELYIHALTCGSGLGVYMSPEDNRIHVLETRRSQVVVLAGPYADEYGRPAVRGYTSRQLTLNDDLAHFLLSLWIRSRWNVEFTVVSEMKRRDLRLL